MQTFVDGPLSGAETLRSSLVLDCRGRLFYEEFECLNENHYMINEEGTEYRWVQVTVTV